MVLSFAPLRPDEVAPRRELLARDLLIVERTVDTIHWVAEPCELLINVFIIIAAFLSVELFLPMVATIPPGATGYDLANRGVVVSLADIETENLS